MPICRPTMFAALVVLSLGSALAQEPASPPQAIEGYLNPFGDPWAAAEVNPDTRIIGTFPCHRTMPETFWEIPEEQRSFLASQGVNLVLSECADLLAPSESVPEEYTPHVLRDRVSRVKKVFPGVRYLGYHSFSVYRTAAPGYAILYSDHKDWFLLKNPSARSKDDFVLSRKGNFILDITNAEFQDFIAARVAESLDAYGMDGFLADEVFHSTEALTDAPEVPERVRLGWAEGWAQLLAKVNEAIGPERILLANVNENQVGFVKAVLPSVDGVFLEDPLGPLSLDLSGSRQLADYLEVLRAAAALDKYVITVVNTNVNGTTYRTTTAEQEHRFARYYLAAHSIFTDGEKALMAYYTPSAGGDQFRSQAFFTDWNLAIGAPAGGFEMVREDVFFRPFRNAHVYLNNSDAPYEVIFGECCSLLTPEGKRVAEYTMPPKTGMFFVGGSVVDEIQ